MFAASIALMAGLGFAAALLLALASRLFHVDEDPAVESIRSLLPGIDCGGCGLAGCLGAARAMAAGRAAPDACVSADTDTLDQLARLMGRDLPQRGLRTAAARCNGGNRAERKYLYTGLRDCRAEALLYGGSPVCPDGCLGHGTCLHACQPGALTMERAGRPGIDRERCRACGACASVCPRGVIRVTGLARRLTRLDLADDCLAPCHQKCPAQIDIPGFIRQVARQDYEGALLTLKERNPLVMTAGRVCLHSCEPICRRNLADQAVAIGKLERFVGEWEMNLGRRIRLPCLPDTGFRVAVIGSGPAGLSCAYFLRRLGHHPTLLEANPGLGGLLRYGIPRYRLPMEVVDFEIDGILELGVEAQTRVTLGRDIFLGDLFDQGYSAVFLGLGAWVVPALCIQDEEARGVMTSLDFLAGAGSAIPTLEGVHVAVVGESNTALDCARIGVRLRAASVTLLCPCERKAMSARKPDVDRAVEEGVVIRFSVMPFRLDPGPDGRVEQIAYTNTESHVRDAKDTPAAESGRLEASLVIAAFERVPDLDALQRDPWLRGRVRATRKGTLAVDADTQLAASPSVFAAGDLQTGRSTVISAVAGGRRAARSIHDLLTRGRVDLPADLHRRLNAGSILKEVKVRSHAPRESVPDLPAEIRIRSLHQEISGSFKGPQAAVEARRCLDCGTACYGRNEAAFTSWKAE